jgi:hypothetical protein
VYTERTRRGVALAPLALLLGGLLALVGAIAPLSFAGSAAPVAHAAHARVGEELICAKGTNPRSAHPGSPQIGASFVHTIHVPADRPTIQAAVDAAKPGDLVLIAAGTYKENVVVCSPDITIRGADRNTTVLDGTTQEKRSSAFTVLADNVVIENLTAHHYSGNGFWWYEVTGYRGSYLTAYDNGDYGIYAFGSTVGQFDHSYASGSPDSGFYIGQCFPCDALITDVHSELNGLGYSGTNAGGNLTIQNSEWDMNGAGIVPNTLDSEGGPPQRGATLTGNYVHDNGTDAAPYNHSTHPGEGAGIALPGGDLDYVANNRVVNSSLYGILVIANVDSNLWLASGNVVEHNRVSGSGLADLALAGPAGGGNCFADNQAKTTAPALLEQLHPCGSPLALNSGGDFGITLRLLAQYVNTAGTGFHPPDYRQVQAPPAQANMPDVQVPPAPLFTQSFTIDHRHGSYPAATTPGGPGMLQPLGFTTYSIVQILLALYGNLLLFALYAAWLAVAFVELASRSELSDAKRFGWGALVLAVPIIGPIVYFFGSGSKLSRRLRLALVVGAPMLCLVITALLMVISSFVL